MSSDELILVTGGTGGLGRRVAQRLRNAGRRVRVVSRRQHEPANGIEYVVADLAKDEGVEPTLVWRTTASIILCRLNIHPDRHRQRGLRDYGRERLPRGLSEGEAEALRLICRALDA